MALAIPAILVLTGPLRAQNVPPPDLWDISTGEQIPGAEVLKTKDFGTIVAHIQHFTGFFKHLREKHLRASLKAEGFQEGDIILGVDGMRTYGWREFELARFRNKLTTSMTLLINRKGDLQWLKLNNLAPGHTIGTDLDRDQEHDRFISEIESLGINVTDDKVRYSLRTLPPRAAAELEFWSTSGKPPSQDETAWVQDFITLYSAVQQGRYSEAAPPAHQPPIGYFQRLEKFYLWYAAVNQPKEVPPDYKPAGETPEFYLLALPVPDYRSPLGDLSFSDRRFQILLNRSYATDADAELAPDISAAADQYAGSKADSSDVRFLDLVRAAFLNHDKYDTLPYDNDLVQSSAARTLLIQEFTGKLKDPGAPDRALYVAAMIPLKLHDGDGASAADYLIELGKMSQYLARWAGQGAQITHPFLYFNVKVVGRTSGAFADNGGFLGPNAPELYRWALTKVNPAAVGCQEVYSHPPAGPYTLLTTAPYAELQVLTAAQSAPEAVSGTSP